MWYCACELISLKYFCDAHIVFLNLVIYTYQHLILNLFCIFFFKLKILCQ